MRDWLRKYIKEGEAGIKDSYSRNHYLKHEDKLDKIAVDSFKKSGNFGKEVQIVALNKAKELTLAQLIEEVKEYIIKNYGNINNWLITQIEVTINLIKN